MLKRRQQSTRDNNIAQPPLLRVCPLTLSCRAFMSFFFPFCAFLLIRNIFMLCPQTYIYLSGTRSVPELSVRQKLCPPSLFFILCLLNSFLEWQGQSIHTRDHGAHTHTRTHKQIHSANDYQMFCSFYDARLKVKGWKSNVDHREQTAAGWTNDRGGGVVQQHTGGHRC